MLDDLKLIHQRDAEDALGIAEKQGEQLLKAFEITGNTTFENVDNVVYAGMGGSALAASLLPTWPGIAAPFEIVRNYELPAYVGPNTLVIVASYSGNTEETLSALKDAETRGAQIAIIAGGGKLQEAAEEKGYPQIVLPKAAQPRYAVLYNFRALLDILVLTSLLDKGAVIPELEGAAAFISAAAKAWRPDVPIAQNPAKQLALEMIGKSVVVYGGPKMYPAARKWKIGFNENAKQVAWAGQYPEFNHNEFIGWSKQPVDKPYAVVDLRSSFEHARVRRRFEVSARLLSGMRPDPYVVEAQGDTLLEQLLWTIVYGDFVTIYTAILNGVNPAPVDLVEKFKKELN
ncbi:MAG TPA: bifunctional phosphoglucose/phosphomannose isomerase [Candidatus Saccharimonadales bacterium]